jgi:hypothetical protein
MRQGMNNESILVEYTLYLITDQSLDSSILMIFCTTMQTYFQFQLLLYHPAEDDEFITLDENTLFETFDGFIENAPNVLQQLNLPLKRNNVDKGKNPYGNLLLNLCRGNDLFIVNGRIGDNKEGNLTCRNASVVDYTICNSEFLKKHCKYEYFNFSVNSKYSFSI